MISEVAAGSSPQAMPPAEGSPVGAQGPRVARDGHGTILTGAPDALDSAAAIIEHTFDL